MKIAGIDFPGPLLSALRDNRLVIFAGAGVSMGEPARLPDFDGLAQQIAAGTGKTRDDKESEDRFLGQLQSSGVDVHRLAAQALSGDSLQPTPLHHDLLRCFPNGGPVRVVTTNFDLLFEQAAGEAVAERDIYPAPALPRGRNFSGIVHVHGSVERPADMVLTDGDFGRAYLTEGWARQFLLDLFQTFTVLFVGYGHNDPVMQYLARALPVTDEPKRFALADDATDSRWELLGISSIPYPMPSENDHSGLSVGIAGLAAYMQRGILDWQRTIRDIAQGPPPLDPEHADLIDDALSDPIRTRFFTRSGDRSRLDRLAGCSGTPDRDLQCESPNKLRRN